MQYISTDRERRVRTGDMYMVQNSRTYFARSIKGHLEPNKLYLDLSFTLSHWQISLLIKGSLEIGIKIVHVNVSRRLIINTTEGGVIVRSQGARESATEAIDIASDIQSIEIHCVL